MAASPTASPATISENAYRVLLTRARQGMAIVVPPGDVDDPTRLPAFYDPIYAYLKSLGLAELGAARGHRPRLQLHVFCGLAAGAPLKRWCAQLFSMEKIA